MGRWKSTAVETVLEHLIEHGPSELAGILARAFELAMQIERERFLGAGRCERSPERQGYANGYKPKRIDTPAGTVTVQVPKTAGHSGEPFHPQSLERGRGTVRAMLPTVAEMYIRGIFTREAERGMRECGIKSLSSSQFSRAARMPHEELEAWRSHPLGEHRYLLLDARYEKMRVGGVVRDAAALSTIGIHPAERRRVLGASVALSSAEVHGRDSLRSLHARSPRGVEYIVSDNRAGLHAARKAVFGAAKWQHRQFHLARNAVQHAPTLEIRKRLRTVWTAEILAADETALADFVASYRGKAPKLADSPEKDAPESRIVFALSKFHRKRMRTSNPIERAVQHEFKRRTVKVRGLTSDNALERLVLAILVQIEEKWASNTKAYINWKCQDA